MADQPSVSFMTYDWAFGTDPLEPNGCAWYRCALPQKELNKYEWQTGIGMPGWNEEHGFGLLIEGDRAVHGWDIIVLKLVMLETVAEKIKTAQAMGQKIVVDIDDWFEGLDEANMAHKTTDPKNNPKNNREHYQYIIDHADALITSTPFLYDWYKNVKKNKNVFMVRNGIDLDRWNPRKDHAGWLPTVGWVGATPWRSRDLETMQPFFARFMEKNRLTFHHSGHVNNAAYASKQIGLHQVTKVTREGMQPISRYPSLFRKIDIGLVPLSGVQFNDAKSGIKGLEYSAAGVPWIASDSPEYALLSDLGIGRVANSPEAWEAHLEALLDPRVRKEDIERNFDNIRTYQTMEVRGHEWNEVMHQILEL